MAATGRGRDTPGAGAPSKSKWGPVDQFLNDYDTDTILVAYFKDKLFEKGDAIQQLVFKLVPKELPPDLQKWYLLKMFVALSAEYLEKKHEIFAAKWSENSIRRLIAIIFYSIDEKLGLEDWVVFSLALGVGDCYFHTIAFVITAYIFGSAEKTSKFDIFWEPKENHVLAYDKASTLWDPSRKCKYSVVKVENLTHETRTDAFFYLSEAKLVLCEVCV